MKPRTEDNTIAIPPALAAEIQAAADEEKRSAEDVLREAIERYLRNRRWQRTFAYGEERARALGLSEEDIPRLIAESRQEQRQGR
jgi:predicted transcriptional regulator